MCARENRQTNNDNEDVEGPKSIFPENIVYANRVCTNNKLITQ